MILVYMYTKKYKTNFDKKKKLFRLKQNGNK